MLASIFKNITDLGILLNINKHNSSQTHPKTPRIANVKIIFSSQTTSFFWPNDENINNKGFGKLILKIKKNNNCINVFFLISKQVEIKRVIN